MDHPRRRPAKYASSISAATGSSAIGVSDGISGTPEIASRIGRPTRAAYAWAAHGENHQTPARGENPQKPASTAATIAAVPTAPPGRRRNPAPTATSSTAIIEQPIETASA